MVRRDNECPNCGTIYQDRHLIEQYYLTGKVECTTCGQDMKEVADMDYIRNKVGELRVQDMGGDLDEV